MASSLARISCFKFVKRVVLHSRRTFAVKVTMGDPLEHATGLEKREMLAQLAGKEDPYAMGPVKRGPGTKDEPTEIPSAFDSRLVGCICDQEATCIKYMWLHKECPKRCECGHWFVLVYHEPL